MEGLLLSDKEYEVNEGEAKVFLKELSDFCKGKEIKLCLISGFHEKVANKKFNDSYLKEYFDERNFLYVNENYIEEKGDNDKKLFLENLGKDPEFNDSYFKQVAMQKFLEENSIEKEAALLLSDDVWVDGFYSTKFSKIDFAIFEDNIVDRGNPIGKIEGLPYFSFNFDSVKSLMENFPVVDFFHLKKFVNDAMTKVLLKDVDFSKVIEKKMGQMKNE